MSYNRILLLAAQLRECSTSHWLVLVPLHCCNRVIQTEWRINNIMYFSQVRRGWEEAEDQGTADSLSGEGHISAHRSRPPSPWVPTRRRGKAPLGHKPHPWGHPSESNQFPEASPPNHHSVGVCFNIWILERHKHSVYHICILKMG